MLFPSYQQSIFALDPAAGLTDANLWKDSSPYGLHVTPVNYAAPNYGYAVGPSGAPYIGFNGANQRGDVLAPALARFYTALNNSSVLTVAAVVRSNAPAVNDDIFTCLAVAGRGFGLRYLTTSRMVLDTYDAGGVLSTMRETTGLYDTSGRTSVMLLSFNKTGGIGLAWRDGVGEGITITGNANPIAYDAAVAPTVGCYPGGGSYFDGSLYFMGIWPMVFTDQEARNFSAYWLDRC